MELLLPLESLLFFFKFICLVFQEIPHPPAPPSVITDYEPEEPTDEGIEDYGDEVEEEYEEYPEINQALPFSTSL